MRWLSLGVLGAAAAVLAASWDRIPSRWAVHWGGRDQPDGWASKSVPSVLAPLAIGFAVWLVIEGAAVWMRLRAARERKLAPELVGVHLEVAHAAGLAVALICAALALVLPLVQPRSSIPIVAGTFACLGIVVGASVVRADRQVRKLRAAGVPVPEGHQGVLYRNPADKRLWVPKLMGMGWTINFAHRAAWPTLLAMVGAPLLVVLIIGALFLR